MIATADLLATVRSEFDFEVNKLPLRGPDNLGTPWYGLFRDDNGQAVGPGSVSDGYQPHKTEQVLALVEAAINGFGGEAVQARCYFKNGHYVSVAPSREHRKVIYGSDAVWPRLFIKAGLGGSASFSCTVGYYRDLCKNLAMMRSVKSCSVSFRHTAGIADRISELTRDFQGLREGWRNMSDTIDMMSMKEVNVAEVLKQVYGTIDPESSKKAKTIGEKRIIDIVSRLMAERQPQATANVPRWDVGYASAWEVYNAVQGYHLHDSPRRAQNGGDKPNTWDRIISTANNTSVLRAESILLSA